jgi:enterobactin synthetase component D
MSDSILELCKSHSSGLVVATMSGESADSQVELVALKDRYEKFESLGNVADHTEFLRGRLCAKKALDELLGANSHLVGRGEKKEPIWPVGVLGSISHTGDEVCAVVGRRGLYSGIGIDLECVNRSIQKIGMDILTESDVGRPESWTEEEFLLFIFSAKESLYKAVFPSVNQFFDFSKAAVVEIGPDSFKIKLTGPITREVRPETLGILQGSYRFFDHSIFTIVTY